MKIVRTVVFPGPSVHWRKPVIAAGVDFADGGGRVVGEFGDGFVAGLGRLFADLGIEADDAKEARGDRGLSDVLVGLALGLQRLSGAAVDHGQVVSDDGARPCWLFYEFETSAVGLRAGELALVLIARLVEAAGQGRDLAPSYVAGERARFLAFARAEGLHEDTRYLLAEARARGIPATLLKDRYVLFGQGRYQRLTRLTMTDATPAFAERFADDRQVTNQLLERLGLLVAAQRTARSGEEAVAAADDLGYPVVVGPRTRGGGRGVHVGIADAHAVAAAFADAARFDRTVLVEAMVPGDEHRLLVVGGRLVAAATWLPGSEHAIVDVTDAVHPDIRDGAILAARELRLDIAGVDFVGPDIGRSYRDAGGAFIGVDCRPELGMHYAPQRGRAREVAGPIFDLLFPPGTPARIPVAAVTGTNGKTTTCRMLAHILRRAGKVVGMVTTTGTYVDDLVLEKGDCAGPVPVRRVLQDRRVDAAVLEAARGAMIRAGLGFDECDVGAVTNVSNDHLGQLGVRSLEQMARVKSLVVQVARDVAVLNADDPLCLAMRRHVGARRVCYVTKKSDHPEVVRHIEDGGLAVVLDRGGGEGVIEVHDDGKVIPVIAVKAVPATLDGLAAHNIENAMFAVALAHGLGVDVDTIRRALGEFRCSFEMNPGRFNVYDGHPFRVVVDLAHNEAGYRAICEVVAGMRVEGRRLCALTMAGDRSDEHIREVARIVAPHFDRFVCYSSTGYRRGRSIEEVPATLGEALTANGVADRNVKIVVDETEAIEVTLRDARPGDFVALFNTSLISQTWQQVTRFRPQL